MKTKDQILLEEAYEKVNGTSLSDALESHDPACIQFTNQTDIPFKQIYIFVDHYKNERSVTIITFGEVSIPSALADRVNLVVDPDQKQFHKLIEDKSSKIIIIKPLKFPIALPIMNRCNNVFLSNNS